MHHFSYVYYCYTSSTSSIYASPAHHFSYAHLYMMNVYLLVSALLNLFIKLLYKMRGYSVWKKKQFNTLIRLDNYMMRLYVSCHDTHVLRLTDTNCNQLFANCRVDIWVWHNKEWSINATVNHLYHEPPHMYLAAHV